MIALVLFLGLLLGAFMGLGHALWGLGTDLTLMYLPITIAYIVASVYLASRIARARKLQGGLRGRPWLLLVLSWVSALLFGFTVPGRSGAQLESISSLWFGEGWRDMSIALCNPFGILAFTFLGGAIAVAIVSARPPAVDED